MERPSGGGGPVKFRHVVKGSDGDHIRIPGEIYNKIWGDSTKAIPGLSEHYGPLVGKTIEFTHAGGFKFLLKMMDDGMGENRHELPRDVQKGAARRGVVIEVSSDSSDNEAEGDGVEAIQGGVGGTGLRKLSQGHNHAEDSHCHFREFLWRSFSTLTGRSITFIRIAQESTDASCCGGKERAIMIVIWGGAGYQFVKDKRLRYGDIVRFETVRENFKYAEVTIVRQGEDGDERDRVRLRGRSWRRGKYRGRGRASV
ncbi:B3 domain-containing protein [Sesbania bispinosa]|nr:B3 domain-containing protein [Sesbania bispinosa]